MPLRRFTKKNDEFPFPCLLETRDPYQEERYWKRILKLEVPCSDRALRPQDTRIQTESHTHTHTYRYRYMHIGAAAPPVADQRSVFRSGHALLCPRALSFFFFYGQVIGSMLLQSGPFNDGYVDPYRVKGLRATGLIICYVDGLGKLGFVPVGQLPCFAFLLASHACWL